MSTFYYAVHRGRTPGIYATWQECQQQINGFPYTEYKKFKNLEDAQNFVINGRDTSNNPRTHSTTTVKSTVKNPLCRTTVKKSIKKPKLNSESIDKEMQKLFNDKPDRNITGTDTAGEIYTGKTNKAKSTKALDIDINSDENNLFVFTDGSCTRNGKKNAKGGVGVHFPHKQFTDVSEKLQAIGSATNNQAELMAISIAIQIVEPYSNNYDNIYIISDSTYSIDCFTKNIDAWIKNKWIRYNGKPVLNKELIQSTYELLKTMNNVTFAHINSHTGKKGFFYDGNKKADELAVKGQNKK